MTDKQPALFDWATELSDAQGHVTLSEQEAHEIGARLRRLHSENETLQAGYAAARLEIESLQARIKTMTEEQAELRRLSGCCTELNLSNYGPDDVDELNGWAIEVSQCIDRALAAQPAPQQEPSHTAVQLAELVLSDCGHSSNYTPLLDRVAARIDSHVERRLDELRRCLESKQAPQPTHTPQADSQPAVDALAEAEYFIDNPSAWSNFDQRASDAIAAVCNAFRAAHGKHQYRPRLPRRRFLAAEAAASSTAQDGGDVALFTTPAQRGELAGDGKPCNNDHDPDCRWPDCLCRTREAAARAAQEGKSHGLKT